MFQLKSVFVHKSAFYISKMAAPIRQHGTSLCTRLVRGLRNPKYMSNNLCTHPKLKKSKFAKCPPRVLSGIQPTGIPHLGNYVGAIKVWLELQEKYEDVIFSIVDMHSITVPQDPSVLRDNILNMTACLLACGIDPKKCTLFQQSSVPQHAELNWILSCLCTLPRLQHLPQWKDKSTVVKDPTVGLFAYPILQSADILLYKGTIVPVGEDQIHHIELARDLAKAFNRSYGVIFPQPTALIGEVPRIKSLRSPDKKMSKSEDNPIGRIELTDTPDEIVSKIKKAQTDSTSRITYDPLKRLGIANLIDIHCALTGKSPDDVCAESSELNTLEYKLRLAELVVEHLKPIREETQRLMVDKGYLLSVLQSGCDKATSIASVTMKGVKQVVGFT